MVLTIPDQIGSPFLTLHMPELLERFSFSYEQDDTCLEYYLYNKKDRGQISKTLIYSHNTFSKSLYVSKFYPEIYKELNCKYLSATCFYLLAHHAVGKFHLLDNCDVTLETDTCVFEQFYSKLNEFDFRIKHNRPSDRVCLTGHYHALPFSTDMIKAY